HDARRDGAQPRLLDAGGGRTRPDGARRAHLRDDLVGRRPGAAPVRARLRRQGGPRVPHPTARLGARAARDHGEFDPGGRHRHPRPPEDPGPRDDQGGGPPPQSERAPHDPRGRGAGDRRALSPRHLLDHGQRHRRRRRGGGRRMTYTQGIVLGVVQGVTEFLPVSSSGHLILVPYLLGWPDQGLAFDAVMHLGTLAALVAYFRAELRAIATSALGGPDPGGMRRLGLLLVAATIPAGLGGGLDRSTAARFAFLLGIPITAGAGGLKALHVLRHGMSAGDGGPLAAALLASFLAGWTAVWFLVGYLRRNSLVPFVI